MMKPTKKQIRALAHMTVNTRPAEITCDDWLDLVGRYAELVFAGKTVPAELHAVEEHLKVCPECTEEFEALQKTLLDD